MNESNISFHQNLTAIQQFYARKTIFITGGTGFIGKLVVEKLLRSCCHLKKIYLLVREKKGKSPEERLSELLDNKAFSRVHIFNENYKKQVEIIEGCLEKDGLGISAENKKRLIKEVDVVFHIGASVRFDCPLRYNANANVKATREMVKLAREMENLKMFIYVSTAYSFSHLKNVEERIYDVPYTPEAFMKLVDESTDEELQKKESAIIGEWYNSYVFTKAIAENVVLTEGRDLPRAIVRPSIVFSAVKEPFSGWVDTIFGPIGTAIASGLGVLHILYVNEKVLADFVPADFVVNHTISAAYHANKNNGKDLKVYTCSSSLQNPFYFRDFLVWCYVLGRTMYSTKQVFHAWYFNTTNYMLFMILHTIFHVPPALLFDFVLKCQGKRPMAMKMLKRMVLTFKMTEKFNQNNMVFHNENTQDMVNKMSLIDQEIFYCDISKLCWHEYMYLALRGGRHFLLGEDSFSLKGFYKSYNRGKWLERIHYILVTSILSSFIYLLYRKFLA